MHDFRNELCQTKHFLCVPDPLLAYLCSLKLTVNQLVIFLIHWSAGQINGNWKSQLTVALVARKASCSEATVKRAYSVLAELGLVRRTECSRGGILTTEVLIPTDAEEQLRAKPNRSGAKKGKQPSASPLKAISDEDGLYKHDDPDARKPPHKNPDSPIKAKDNGKRFHQEFSESLATELAKKIIDCVGEQRARRIWHEMLWSISHGHHHKQDMHPRHKMNCVLKLLNMGEWSTPNDMPLNWEWKHSTFPTGDMPNPTRSERQRQHLKSTPSPAVVL